MNDMWPRREGWEARLAQLIETAPHIPFVWGRRDCCLWAADVVHTLTERDPASGWRGTYDSDEAALRTLRGIVGAEVHPSAYVATMAEQIAVDIGAPEIESAFARRGDVALIEGPLGRALAAVDLTGRHLVGVTVGGVARVPRAAGLRFWAIG